MKINHWKKLYCFNINATKPNIFAPRFFYTKYKQPLIILFSLVGLFVLPSQSAEDVPSKTASTELSLNDPFRFLHHYKANYLVMSGGDTLGKAERTLVKEDQLWTLNTYAKVSKYFLTLRNTEKTQFHIKNAKLLVDYFYSNSKLTFKKARKIEQKFDWDNKIETGSYKKKKWQRPIISPVFDRVSHLIQLRADLIAGKQEFSYPISHKGKDSEYTYQLEKEEVIPTKMGNLNSVKLVRIKTNGDKFVFWLCPELNYIPVKIAQYEIDEPDITLLIDSLEYNPKPSN